MEGFTGLAEPGHRLPNPLVSSLSLRNSNCIVKDSVDFVVLVGADGLDSSHAVLAHVACGGLNSFADTAGASEIFLGS